MSAATIELEAPAPPRPAVQQAPAGAPGTVGHADEIDALLRDGGFVRRPASWVATRGDAFFKIPRRSDDCAADLADADALAEAEAEHAQASLLARHEPAVNRPVARVRACLVYPRIDGADLLERLRRERDAAARQALVEEAVTLCARLHRVAPEALAGVPRHDYRRDPFVPAPAGIQRRIHRRGARLVVRGFESRNFRVDAGTGRLVFFDPHALVLGLPEEDFTRFVLSLLMLRWGRRGPPSPWTRFDPAALRAAYERAAGEPLDPVLVGYTFDLNLRMRRENAERSIAAMRGRTARLAARAYAWFHFRRIDAWRRRHEL